MNNLPVCRLCKSKAYINSERATCSNVTCEISGMFYRLESWRKLMYVPEKMTYMGQMTRYQIGEVDGYNAAIDDMLRGGG